ncbi:MAG: YfcC family protein [Clostridia bacterium]|nr:YfcC family protein [Clostridia bacterium]
MGNSEASIKIGKRTFITAIIILAALMLTAGIMTKVIPAGSYDRVITDGREIIQQGTYHLTEAEDYPAWRWLTAPFEVFGSEDGPTIIVIILFIFAIASAISLLEKSGVMAAVLSKIVKRFIKKKYMLMAIIVFFFMLLGAVLGTFEENIALVPIIIALAYSLKWDSMVGLGMSILASCFGFTSAITNPFSIAITQKISDLPLYSGTGFRIIIFIAYYALLMTFLLHYAKKIEKNPEKSLVYGEDQSLREKYSSDSSLEEAIGSKSEEESRNLDQAMTAFNIFIVLVFVLIVVASFIPGLADVQLPLIGIIFFIGSLFSARKAGLKGKHASKVLKDSVIGIAPGIILILMAMSVKFIIASGGIMDTILYHAANAISGTSPYIAILLIYLLILVLELFVGSSSAKAFLIMPLIAPLSDLVGITRQTSVLAFSFGDGFSNVLYPTNPVLLICLGLTIVAYPKWFKWTYKLQIAAFIMACIFLFIGVMIKYGPF